MTTQLLNIPEHLKFLFLGNNNTLQIPSLFDQCHLGNKQNQTVPLMKKVKAIDSEVSMNDSTKDSQSTEISEVIEDNEDYLCLSRQKALFERAEFVHSIKILDPLTMIDGQIPAMLRVRFSNTNEEFKTMVDQVKKAHIAKLDQRLIEQGITKPAPEGKRKNVIELLDDESPEMKPRTRRNQKNVTINNATNKMINNQQATKKGNKTKNKIEEKKNTYQNYRDDDFEDLVDVRLDENSRSPYDEDMLKIPGPQPKEKTDVDGLKSKLFNIKSMINCSNPNGQQNSQFQSFKVNEKNQNVSSLQFELNNVLNTLGSKFSKLQNH